MNEINEGFKMEPIEILRRYCDGEEVPDIANATGQTEGQINRILQRMGAERREIEAIREREARRMAEIFQNVFLISALLDRGYSPREISDLIDIHYDRILDLSREYELYYLPHERANYPP